jgi:hypothetical protein
VDFKLTFLTRNKDDYFILIKGAIHQEMLTIPAHKGNANQNHHQEQQQKTNVGEDVGKKELSYASGGNVSLYNNYNMEKTTWKFLYKLKIDLPYNPGILLLGIYLKCHSGYNKGTCTSMFTAALFTIAKVWK